MSVRIERAKQLIDSSKLTLQEVSYSCGFGSYKYFSDAFEKSTGQRPSAHRSDTGLMAISSEVPLQLDYGI